MKSLLKKEWIYGKWITIINTFLFMILFSQVFANYMDDIKGESIVIKRFGGKLDAHFYIQNYFLNKTIVMVIAVIIFAVFVIMVLDNFNSGYEVLSSMPYTRVQIIMSKWVTAVSSIILPLIINYCFLTVLYFINYRVIGAFNRYKTLFMWMILSILTYVFIVTFVMFIQSLHGNKVAGAIVSVAMLCSWNIGEELMREFLGLYGFNLGYSNKIYMLPFYNDMSIVLYTKFKIMILIIFSILLLCTIVIIFKKVPIENMNNLSLYRAFIYFLRIYFVAIFTMMIMTIVFQCPNQRDILLYIGVTVIIAGGLTFTSFKVIK